MNVSHTWERGREWDRTRKKDVCAHTYNTAATATSERGKRQLNEKKGANHNSRGMARRLLHYRNSLRWNPFCLSLMSLYVLHVIVHPDACAHCTLTHGEKCIFMLENREDAKREKNAGRFCQIYAAHNMNRTKKKKNQQQTRNARLPKKEHEIRVPKNTKDKKELTTPMHTITLYRYHQQRCGKTSNRRISNSDDVEIKFLMDTHQFVKQSAFGYDATNANHRTRDISSNTRTKSLPA